MSSEKTLPIAEIFTSIQGEGRFTGTPHTFIRLAGCSVGKPIPRDEAEAKGLPAYMERCATWDGREFLCDTNFRVQHRMTVTEILSEIPSTKIRVCITGGEPLIHDLKDLCSELWRRGNDISLETSGTIELPYFMQLFSQSKSLWVAVAPKRGVNHQQQSLRYADEVKLLVDENFNVLAAEELLRNYNGLVWLQPVNDEMKISHQNVHRCLLILQEHPTWRLSVQLHKVLGVR